MVSSGLDLWTFRLVADLLNHLRYHVPLDKKNKRINRLKNKTTEFILVGMLTHGLA
jgi:hypothetical protein